MDLDHLLGFRIDGRPIYGFAGAGDDDGGGGDDGGGSDDGGGDDSGGGDDGGGSDELTRTKHALEQERAAHKTTKSRYREIGQAMRDFEVKSADDLRTRLTPKGGSGGQSGQQQQVDVDALRSQIQREERQKAGRERVLSKIEARAANLFADPEDAVLHMQSDVEDYLDGDRVDVAGIDRDLQSLLTRKPHLGKQKDGSGTDFDGGPRRTASAPKGMDDFLRNLSAERRGGRR
jgi:hypothetical protein